MAHPKGKFGLYLLTPNELLMGFLCQLQIVNAEKIRVAITALTGAAFHEFKLCEKLPPN